MIGIQSQTHSARLVKIAWIAPLGGVLYVVGSMIGGALLSDGLGLTPPSLPLEVSPAAMAAGMVAAGCVLTAGLALVAWGMPGRFAARWLLLSTFMYVAAGLNTALEGSIFTKTGGWLFVALNYLIPSLLCGALAAGCMPGSNPNARLRDALARWAGSRSCSGWTRSLLLALAAFPAIYFFFGVFAGAIVEDYYRQPDTFLQIPPLQVILAMQVVRSALFLAVTLPIIGCWAGSRRSLILCVGLGHFCLVGLSGLITPGLFPMTLRVVHGMEILADSMAYAWALAALVGLPAGDAELIEARVAAA